MDVTLNYGKQGYTLSLPDDLNVTVIRKQTMPVLDDPATVLGNALKSPASCPPLRETAKGRKSACILICDITRPVPNGMILPVVIRELLEAGLAAEDITVLVATGLHRPNEGEELRELVGSDWVLDTVRVENHFARRDEDHVLLGTSSQGTAIKVDKRFVQADLKIVTGLVEPHFMAGYSGGRKVILPGIAHHDTITRFHTATYLEHCKAVNCVMEGNPLHKDQMDGVGMIGEVWAVNTVLDEHRRVSFINFGPLEKSHLEAVAFTRPYSEIKLSRRYKTVITSSAGYPLDSTYYQTVKGMVGAMDALEEGGKLFIVSACTQGMGSPEYVDAQKRLVALGTDGFLNDIMPKQRAAIDEWQTEMQLKPMRRGVICLYTDGLTNEQKALTGVETTTDLDASLAQWLAACGDKDVVVIPEGPYVVPMKD
ncbi:nickel-dependent lactate racemase [Fundidesulfovibrio terrae]|uniref:nickel-dependent lactate racemase n=1 Tax=Fundidesulfovibrio terrae TaxID=2922866 RepID=UPI001FB013CA|nr:nickel-dependent lactate racemase [Fundidesulfovibrio terrae]